MKSSGGILFLGAGAFLLAMAYTGHIRSVWNALVYGDSAGKDPAPATPTPNAAPLNHTVASGGGGKAGAASWAGRVAGPVRPYWQ